MFKKSQPSDNKQTKGSTNNTNNKDESQTIPLKEGWEKNRF